METCSVGPTKEIAFLLWKPSHHHAFDTGSVLTKKRCLLFSKQSHVSSHFIAHVFSIVLKEHDHMCVRPSGSNWQGLWHDDFLSCAVLWSTRVHLESAHARFLLIGYLVCVHVCRWRLIEPMFLIMSLFCWLVLRVPTY